MIASTAINILAFAQTQARLPSFTVKFAQAGQGSRHLSGGLPNSGQAFRRSTAAFTIAERRCHLLNTTAAFVSSAIIIVHKAIVSAAMNKRQRVKRLIVSIALPFSVLKLKYLVIIFCVVSILFRYVGNALATEQGVGKEKNHDIADERHDEW